LDQAIEDTHSKHAYLCIIDI